VQLRRCLTEDVLINSYVATDSIRIGQ